jgi:predicted dehydrogenase
MAVGSRSQESADRFGDRLGITKRHASYEALVADPEVDIVYVATPHPFHCENALMAIGAGKPVLVEKPFAMNAAEARTMIQAAREKGLFAMEAMWMRFLPHMAKIRKIIADGVIGDLVCLQADHGWFKPFNPAARHFSLELGGGALLDLGIYPVSLASMLFGKPDEVLALSSAIACGVDGQTSAVLKFPQGRHAVVNSTIMATVSNRAVITGTLGRIEIDCIFYTPTGFSVVNRDGGLIQRVESDYVGKGLREEAVESARCLREGLTESPLFHWDEIISVMEIMDRIRASAGMPSRAPLAPKSGCCG